MLALVPGYLRRTQVADMVHTSPAEHFAVACLKFVVLVGAAFLQYQVGIECLVPPSLVPVRPSPRIVRQIPLVADPGHQFLVPPIVGVPFSFESPPSLVRNSVDSIE